MGLITLDFICYHQLSERGMRIRISRWRRAIRWIDEHVGAVLRSDCVAGFARNLKRVMQGDASNPTKPLPDKSLRCGRVETLAECSLGLARLFEMVV